MTERNGTVFEGGPIKPSRKSKRMFFRTGSDDQFRTPSTDGLNSSNQSGNPPFKYSPPSPRNPPILKSLSTSAYNGTYASDNGTNGSVNGTNGVHTAGSVSKKSPLLPPGHSRLRKCDSSESSASSNSSGSVFRSADSGNQDGQLSDSSSGPAEPKRPLMPPTKKPSTGAMAIAAMATAVMATATEENEEKGKTKPLPLPPPGSRSPGNTPKNAFVEVKRDGRVLEDGANSGQPVCYQDDQQPDVHHLQTENEALRVQVYRLQQQLLQQKASNSGSDRSETTTPVSRCSSRNAESPNGLTNSEMGRQSPLSGDMPGSRSPVGVDARGVARQQLARVLERAKANSPDAIDSNTSQQMTGKSTVQPVSSGSLSKSPNPSITSPLSPLSPSTSTPSPTALVTFGLASQARRKGIKKSNARRMGRESDERLCDSTKNDAQTQPKLPERTVEPGSTTADGLETLEEDNSSECQPLKPGQFAGKGKASIVSATAKIFQQNYTENEANSNSPTDLGVNDRVDSADATSHESVQRDRESVKPENNEVFSPNSATHSPPQSVRPQQSSPVNDTGNKSQRTSSPAEEELSKAQKSGVVTKRVPIKSDNSWIKARLASAEEKDKRNAPSQRSQSPSTSPLPPYRSHQIINTVSPPPPPNHALPPPRTFNRSPQQTSPATAFSSKPSARHHRSQDRINVHAVSEGGGEGKRERVLVKKGSSKSKRQKEGEGGITRSASDESLRGTIARGSTTYSSQRVLEVTSKKQRPSRPPPVARNQVAVERLSGRPSSLLSVTPPRAWEDGHADFSVSCIVPSATPTTSSSDKSPKRSRKKKSSNPSPLTKKGSIFDRLKGKPKDKDQPRILEPAVEEEEDYGDSDSSSEDEKGATIKYKPKLRPVSVRRPSEVEDDFDLSYPQLFERVFVVVLRQDEAAKKLVTEVTYTFPPRAPSETVRDETMEAIPQFCFPDIDRLKPTTKFKSETFSFVLTNIEGHRRFGYCRRLLPTGRTARLPEVTCIVSPLGCFSLYEKILDHIEERRRVSTTAVFTFLKAIVANPFPKPGRSVEVRAISPKGAHGMETVTLTRPLDSRLEHVDFSLLFSTLSPRKIIQLFSSMLMERRIILCSSNLSLMTGCAHALLALLYPFEWQHVFIPVLPNALIDFCCSPLPYMMGMSPSLIPALDDMETMEEALVVDLDKKKFARKIGDETSILPSKLYQYLENMLSVQTIVSEYQKPAGKRTSPCRADEIVINTFMVFFVYLYGDYKKYMKKSSNGGTEFQRKEYEQKFSSKSIRRFLEAFHMTQMFENFIEQRENPLKADTTAQSTFERNSIHDLKDRCLEIEIFSSKSKISRWRLLKRS